MPEPKDEKEKTGLSVLMSRINDRLTELEKAEKILSRQNLDTINFQEATVHEISELHTQVNNNAIETHKRCRNIEEILREFGKGIIKVCEELNFEYDPLINNFIFALEKLDQKADSKPSEPFKGTYQCQKCLKRFNSLEMCQDEEGDLVCPSCSGDFIVPYEEPTVDP